MHSKRFTTAALVATAAVAAGPAAGAPAAGKKQTKLTCGLQLYSQGMPNPSAIQFGFATCPKPFGRGVHHNAYTVSPTGIGQGTVAGRFRNYYALGTAAGTFALTFSATSPGNITYKGTVTYTGGTGTFRNVKGPGTIECASTDGGAHRSCTVNSTLTGL